MLENLTSETIVGIALVQVTMMVGHVLAFLTSRGKTEARREENRDAATAHIEQHARDVAASSREMFVALNAALMESLTAARQEIAAARAEAAETRRRVDVLIAHVERLEEQLARHGVDVPPRPAFGAGAA